MMRELFELAAVDLVGRIRERQVSAKEYAQELIKKCKDQEHLNAFIHFEPDEVLRQARDADHKQDSGQILGPLHGIPIVVKDNFDIAGYCTTAGTPGLRGHSVTRTAPVVQALIDAGAVILGKTNMHEMAFGPTSNNITFGAVRNPVNRNRIAGGSSGGTAAAIASDMTPLGIGTDTAGSVRVPAALCGLVGLRPTMNSYSRSGIVPLSKTRDTAGPMARNVVDLVLLHGVMLGRNISIVPANLEGLRIGVRRNDSFLTDPSVSSVVDEELHRLRVLGAECIDVEVSDIEDNFINVARPITIWEAPEEIERYLKESGSSLAFEDLVDQIVSPDVKPYFQAMKTQREDLHPIYRQALDKSVPKIRSTYTRYFQTGGIDVMVYPTTPIPAGAVGENKLEIVGGREVWNGHYLLNTTPITLTGMPGLTLPIGRTALGLPVGLEMVGPVHSDNRLLSIGLAWEDSRGDY